MSSDDQKIHYDMGDYKIDLKSHILNQEINKSVYNFTQNTLANQRNLVCKDDEDDYGNCWMIG